MTVTAKIQTGLMRIVVTLVTIVSIIVVPWPLVAEQSVAGGVKPGIGAPDAVGVLMTPAPGTGRIIGVMAGGTVFNIPSGGPAMVGQPGDG